MTSGSRATFVVLRNLSGRHLCRDFIRTSGLSVTSSRRKKHVTGDTHLRTYSATCVKPIHVASAQFTSIPAPLVTRNPNVALAYTYLGDAVWEVYARQHMICRRAKDAAKSGSSSFTIRPQEATKRGWCSATAMNGHLNRLLCEGALTDEELSILKWGRDYGHESRSGHGKQEHVNASGLEALVAYWYLFDPVRMHQVFSLLGMTICTRPLRDLAYGQTGSSCKTLPKRSQERDSYDVRVVPIEAHTHVEAVKLLDTQESSGCQSILAPHQPAHTHRDVIIQLEARITTLERELYPKGDSRQGISKTAQCFKSSALTTRYRSSSVSLQCAYSSDLP